MRVSWTKVLLTGLLTVFYACTEQYPLSPNSESLDNNNPVSLASNFAQSDFAPGTVTVMTRNIYVGTDVDVILSAQDPQQIPILAAQAFQGLIATNFPERAMALAKEVSQTQPHLIGLQEVSMVRLQSPGDAIAGGTIPAEDVFIDFLEVLMSAFESYGLEYEVAGIIQNVDVEIPMIVSQDPLKFDDIRLTDHDVVLVRKDVEFSDVVTRNYMAKLVIPDLNIEIPRGYISLTANVNGQLYRFVNTHLEVVWDEDVLRIQMAQARELLLSHAAVINPIIMVGDFNTQAPHDPTYQLVTLTHRYLDVWTKNQWTDNPEGFTFGHDADLLNEEENFWERIDFIFVRNRIPFYNTPVLDPVYATVVGDEQADRTPSGLWPSDHGGVVAWLQIPTNTDLAIKEKQREFRSNHVD